MDNPWLLAVGIVAAFLGFANLENARRGLLLRPMTIFWSLVAGYLCSLNFLDLYHAGGAYAMAGFGLAFCTVSPVLGWLWWGRNGEVRRRLLKALAFLFFTAIGFAVWSLAFGTSGVTVALGLGTACLPFLGLRKRFRRARSRRRERRRKRQEARQQTLEARQGEQALVRDQRRTAALKREMETKDRRIAQLEGGEKKRIESLAHQRQEIAEQIRLLREAEVDRVRQEQNAGLQFHSHYGFLMAEAWRVLRAQVARGERIPAAEHDTFFLQVVDELLEPESFGDRYFHEKGRCAIAAVNQYLAGRESLANAHVAVARLKLNPALLAPEPLSEYSGHTLLESWLVPHRRYQDRLREDLQEGRHPQQERVIQFLRERHLQRIPSQQEWRALWDDHPAIFVGIVPEPVAGDGAQPIWRRVVSSIWKDGKAR